MQPGPELTTAADLAGALTVLGPVPAARLVTTASGGAGMDRAVLLKDMLAVLALYLVVDRQDVALTPVPSSGPHVIPDYTLADSFNR